MSSYGNSTIAALCFAKPQALDFGLLTLELGDALRANPGIICREMREFDDFVIFDINRTRICMAYCIVKEEFPHLQAASPFHSTLILSVGSTPEGPGEGPLFDSRTQVCQELVDRVEQRHPSDKFLWIEIDEAFTADVYDMILEQIWPELTEASTYRDLPRADPSVTREILSTSGNRSPLHQHFVSDDAMSDLEARFDAELQMRRTHAEPADDDYDVAPTHEAMYADHPQDQRYANVEELRQELAELLHREPPEPLDRNLTWDQRDARRVRMALYPQMTEKDLDDPRKQPLAARLTIYTLNSAVMVFSLPVGAAVLTYCALGREDIRMPARALALTGAFMGFGHFGFAQSLVQMLT